jgi:hypothetical protein
MTVQKAIFPLFFFFVIRGQLTCIWKGFFDTHHKEATKDGRKVEPFLKYKFLKKFSRQYTTEVCRKHLMTKKVRIKAWEETEDPAINMANCLGHQMLKKTILLAQVFVMPWRVTGIIKNRAAMPQDIILSIVLENCC